MLNTLRKTVLTLSLGFLSLQLGACGDPADTNFIEIETPVNTSERIVSPVEKNSPKGLNLIDASAFTIRVQGCSSGYAVELTTNKTKLNLYKNDLNCLARLVDFTRNGKKYSPVAGKDFVTLAVGEKADFRSADGLDTIIVKVTKQISSPVQAGDSINFAFLESTGNAQSLGLLKIQFGLSGKNTRSGNSPINFKMKRSQLVNIDPATGKGRVVFKLECNVILGRPNNPNADCGGVRLRDLSYVLVADTVNGSPCPSNATACASYFNNAGLSISNQEFIDPGTDGLTNGGFTTRVDATLALLTPGKINVTPNMLMIVTDGKSYQWFNLDFQVNATTAAFLTMLTPSQSGAPSE